MVNSIPNGFTAWSPQLCPSNSGSRARGGDQGFHDSVATRKRKRSESWTFPKSEVDRSSSSSDDESDVKDDANYAEDDDDGDSLIRSSSKKHVRPSPWVLRQWFKARGLEEDDLPSTSADTDAPSADLHLTSDVSVWHKISAAGNIRRWGNQVSAPAFAAPKPDPFLTSSFEAAKTGTSKKPFESTISAMSLCGASGHAALAAAAFIQSFMDNVPPVNFFTNLDAESYVKWKKALLTAFKSGAFKPLGESIKTSAYGLRLGDWMMKVLGSTYIFHWSFSLICIKMQYCYALL